MAPASALDVKTERWKGFFCGITRLPPNWLSNLVEAVAQQSEGANGQSSPLLLPTTNKLSYKSSKPPNSTLFSLPEEYILLKFGKVVPATSRLLSLAPELDKSAKVEGNKQRRKTPCWGNGPLLYPSNSPGPSPLSYAFSHNGRSRWPLSVFTFGQTQRQAFLFM